MSDLQEKPTDPLEELRQLITDMRLQFGESFLAVMDAAIAAWEKERAEAGLRHTPWDTKALWMLRSKVQRVEEEMRAEAKMRMECENVAPDEYGYLIHQADALRRARLGE